MIEILEGSDIAEQLSRQEKILQRKSIIEALSAIEKLVPKMPVVKTGLDKASHSDEGYYSFKVLDSVYIPVRNFLYSIIEKKLVTDPESLQMLLADHNELDNLIVERTEIRENMKRAGKTNKEILDYMNSFGEDQNAVLDGMIKRIVRFLTLENSKN